MLVLNSNIKKRLREVTEEESNHAGFFFYFNIFLNSQKSFNMFILLNVRKDYVIFLPENVGLLPEILPVLLHRLFP